jgi:phosphoribosylaminoimidazole-succinocarboxamide synthase
VAVANTIDLPLVVSGKVREMYDLGEQLLMVASDRISTYDSVHPTPIPGKGQVLTGLSVFWFELTAGVVPNHLVSATERVPPAVRGRALAVRKLEMLPIECVVRGYLSGSGWNDYRRSGAVCGIALPAGLSESERLPRPLFTPASKAQVGDHDENIDFETVVATLGDRALAERLRDASIAVYERAAEHARERGVIVADTKFEFGLAPDGTLVLGDEVLTPDSSRFWDAATYEPGRPQPSFDKQFVRDWATASGWDRSPPAPPIPADVIAGTQARYRDAYERIVGEPLESWLVRSGAPL